MRKLVKCYVYEFLATQACTIPTNIIVTLFYIIWTITWSLAIIIGDNKINNTNKYTSNAGYFDCHADAEERCGAHRPLEHIPGFNRSHWMPSLGECSHHIAAAAAMVEFFCRNHKTQTKNYFWLANLRKTEAEFYENFEPQIGHSTQLINATSFI